MSLPVEPRTRSAAHWALYGLVALPTLTALGVGVLVRLAGGSAGQPFGGMVTLIVLIGIVQLAIVVVGRGQHLSGVSMRTEAPPKPPQNDPGMFRHVRH